MTKKIGLLLILVLSSITAFADDSTFVSTGGTFSGDSHGFILSGATLTQVSSGGSTFSGDDLGTLSFTTAFLGQISNVVTGGPILAGGAISITGNGSDGLPTGILFDGTFPDGGTWAAVTQPDGTIIYTLTADVSGQDNQGNNDSGMITFTLTNPVPFPGTTSAIGTATVSISPTPVSVPEPGQIALFGSGLLGIMGAVWRKRPLRGGN